MLPCSTAHLPRHNSLVVSELLNKCELLDEWLPPEHVLHSLALPLPHQICSFVSFSQTVAFIWKNKIEALQPTAAGPAFTDFAPIVDEGPYAMWALVGCFKEKVDGQVVEYTRATTINYAGSSGPWTKARLLALRAGTFERFWLISQQMASGEAVVSVDGVDPDAAAD